MAGEAHRKTSFIKDLQDGQQVEDLFLVSRKNYAETKAGKPYLALTLMDRSGELEARVWDDAQRLNEIVEVGTVISIQAMVKLFREQLQLNINALRAVERDAVHLEEFMPSSARTSRDMQAELMDLIGNIGNTFLRRLLNNTFRGTVLQQFLTAPAAKMMHHAYIGGLAEHTLSVTRLALKVCDNYPALDRDLLTAGCLVHDIGKIEEFSYETIPFDYTDSGRLIGHLVLGSEMIRKEISGIPEFPTDLHNTLMHLILSHHGRHEFGSPSLPMTREAILLHHLDDIDAKMNLIDKLSTQVEAGQYQWSDYQRTLERFLLLKGHDQEEQSPVDEPGNDRIDEQNPEQPHSSSGQVSEKPRQKPLFE